MGTFVPPFTAGAPVSTSVLTSRNPQVRARFDDRVININIIYRKWFEEKLLYKTPYFKLFFSCVINE